MIVAGLAALVAGGVLALTADGSLGGVDLTAAGAAVMVAGAVLLVAGLLRLRRASRRAVARGPGAAPAPYRTGKGKIFAMIAVVVYIVSPIDLVPDVFLPVGVVDDAGALLWLVLAAGQEMARRRARPLEDG
ncbi:YkvA family protein [Actinomadura rugatobispora]|uniref:YkvA family protein n=1 Tax=Actinomadura rugatobispora TaxID=1994 RepID=A0ABW1AET4_9ACTN|nr:hypothetical protein GCM10010200_105370 [Actinomadura rugatobispora]